MDEEKDIIRYTGERITRVETKIESISVEQKRIGSIVENLNELFHALALQIKSNEGLMNAVISRTDEHAKNIEHLQEKEVDTGTLLTEMKTQVNLIKYIGGAIATFTIAYIFTHFLK